MGGERYFSKEVTDSLISGMHKEREPKSSEFIQKLTRREKEILHLIVEEHTTDEIAEKLFISSTTVISHRKSLLRKLNAKNVAGLVKKAFEFGLLGDE
jgi:DNA-binding NarL/FixJ family response regulator